MLVPVTLSKFERRDMGSNSSGGSP